MMYGLEYRAFVKQQKGNKNESLVEMRMSQWMYDVTNCI